MNVGDRVRVKESVIFYHHPSRRNEPFDAQGLEGTVIAIISDWKGRPVSANFPVHVQFDDETSSKPFRAHLRADELEIINP